VMGVLQIAATGVLAGGIFAAVCGVALMTFTHFWVAYKQPEFWHSPFMRWRDRVTYQARVAQLTLDAENTTSSGRMSDWCLRWATVLVVLGGLGKAILYLVERQPG
jgi:hypothetical protein